MLKGYRILTSFCVICATLYGGAYGAASVRSGTTGRAGSLRTLGAGTTASVKATATSAQPGPSVSGEESDGANTARMAHLTGLGDSKISGKLSLPSAASSQTINELRQAIEQLRSDYEALGNQYDNLSGDVSDVYNTAQVARAAATNNTNTLTVVRSDLNDAKSDIEDLKENGLFNAERVAGTVENVLADKNYATQSQLAVTDAVARGAVQPNQLPQKLNELGVADKDYVDSKVANAGISVDQVNAIVGGALDGYPTKTQVANAIDGVKQEMADVSYVDTQVINVMNTLNNKASYAYVDNKVANAVLDEDDIGAIVGGALDNRLAIYSTKTETANAINAATNDKVDSSQFNTLVANITDNMSSMATRTYVDDKVRDIDLGLDEGDIINIMGRYNYQTSDQVNNIVSSRLNNYYTKSQTDAAINDVADDIDYINNYVTNVVNNKADKTWVTNQISDINNTIQNLDGLDADDVDAIITAKGYKDTQGVKDIVESYGYKTAAEVAAAIAEQMPDIDIQYDSNNNQLKFRDKNGAWQTIDMRGLNGQDGAKVNLRRNNDMIQWQHEGDGSAWNDLLSVSDLAGPAGKSVELVVGPYWGHSRALGWKQEGQSDSAAQFIASLDDLKGPAGPDGCGVTFSPEAYYENGTKVGTKVIFKRDCPNNPGQNGTTLGNIIVRDGVAGEGGDVTEEQILNALEHSNAFAQKADRSQLNDYLMKTEAANTYATQSQFNSLSSTVAGHTNLLSGLDGKTVKQYVDENTPTFRMEKVGDRWYICKSGNCTGTPPYGSGWEEFDMNVDLGNYYTKTESNNLFALKTTVDGHTTDIATLQSDKANKTDLNDYAKLSYIGNLDGYSTVKDYIDTHTPSITVAEGIDGNSYICTGGNCTGTPPGTGWTKLNVDLTSINSEITNLKTDKADKRELDDYLKTTDAASTYLTQTDAAAAYAPIATVTTANTANTTANKAWDRVTDLGNQTTVRSYVDNAVSGLATETYVDNKVATVRPTIMTETYQGTTYICSSGNCTNHAPGEGWEELSVNLDVLEGFGGTGEPQKVKGYIDTELDNKLDKTDIKLTRDGDSIKISGGGIESSYEVANVTDLMCKSYEVEQKERTGEKVTYELKCITSDDE